MDINQISINSASISYTPVVERSVVTQTVFQGNEGGQSISGINEGNTLPQGEQRIAQAIAKAEKLPVNTTECQFSIHSKTNQVMIKVVDGETKEVIKEIPSEKALDIFAERLEVAGLFVDEKK